MWLFEGNTCISSYVWLKANQATPTHLLHNYAWGPLSGLLWKKRQKEKKENKCSSLEMSTQNLIAAG